MSPASAKHRSRQGFTLLELLIVIAIIGTLASLTIFVMNGITDRALREATKATIQKINGLMQQRVESFDRAFRDDRRKAGIRIVVDQLGLPDDKRKEHKSAIAVVAKKLEFRFQFPQRVEDRLNAPNGRDPQVIANGNGRGLPQSLYERIAFPVARTQLIEKTGGTPTVAEVDAQVNSNWENHDPDTESAELLYFALIRSESFGATVSGADQFSGSEIADTDNDGIPEFIDAWGNPLRFYRWPTRLVDRDAPVPFNPILAPPDDPTDTRVISDSERRVAGILLKGLPPAPDTFTGIQQREFLLVDPDDPIGLLYTLLEDVNLQSDINEDTFHTIDTFHTPLIVSAGVDENLGLYEPWRVDTGIYGTLAQPDGTNFVPGSGTTVPTPTVEEAMLDNVTNRNRRAGGRR